MKDQILKIMAGFDLDAAVQPAIEAAYLAGVQSTQCYLLARPKSEWFCDTDDCGKAPAVCFLPTADPDGAPVHFSCSACCNHDYDDDGLCVAIEHAVPDWWPKAADGSPAWVQVHEDGACWSLVPDGTAFDRQQVIARNDVLHTCAEFCDSMELPFEFKQEPLS